MSRGIRSIPVYLWMQRNKPRLHQCMRVQLSSCSEPNIRSTVVNACEESSSPDAANQTHRISTLETRPRPGATMRLPGSAPSPPQPWTTAHSTTPLRGPPRLCAGACTSCHLRDLVRCGPPHAHLAANTTGAGADAACAPQPPRSRVPSPSRAASSPTTASLPGMGPPSSPVVGPFSEPPMLPLLRTRPSTLQLSSLPSRAVSPLAATC
jgi:hypothetical protein